MTLGVDGIVVTVLGFTLQLPLPETRAQLRVIVPVNPLGAVTLIGPLVAVLPAFTVGKGVGSLRVKSGVLLRTCRTSATWFVV